MSENVSQQVASKQGVTRAGPNAVVGVLLSSFALVGWLVTVVLMFSFQYEEYTADSSRNTEIGYSNIATFLIRATLGLAGLLAFGFLFATGTLVSASGLTQEPKRLALAGLWMGLAGLLIGLSLIIWRIVAWGLLG